MLFDLINLDKLRRGILYGGIMLLALFLQNTVLSRITILGVRAMFLPILMVAVGMFEGGVWGGVLGLLTGFLCDMNFQENVVMFTLLFPAIGFFSGVLANYAVNRRFFSFFFLSLTMLLLTGLCQSFHALLFCGAGLAPVARVIFLQALWALPFTVPLYFLCKSLAGRSLLD